MGNDESILQFRDVKPTANRILVVRAMQALSRPVSLPELEDILSPMDKSSIFRVLTLFVLKHVVHEIEDGSGMMRYELCGGGEDGCSLEDMHTHFYCERCRQTFCFKSISIPKIPLPEGYEMHSVNYMVKGLCPECAAKG